MSAIADIDSPQIKRALAAFPESQGLFPDCGRVAGLNRVGTSAYSSDVRAATNFRGAEKSPGLAGGSIFYGPMAKRK
jgi:hypothetical protein